MRKKLIVIGLISAITAAPAFAEGTTSKQEAAGIGAGATVGAIVGGPVGLMIGAAIGLWSTLKIPEAMILFALAFLDMCFRE